MIIETSKVSSLMLNDHLRLLSLLHKIESSQDSLEKRYEAYMDFIWNIEKHFFIEEKTIFKEFSLRKEEIKVYNMYLELTKQHTNILNELEKMKSNFAKGLGFESFRLRDLLIAHQKFEEKLLYPKFDEELDIKSKEKIFSQINEILL